MEIELIDTIISQYRAQIKNGNIRSHGVSHRIISDIFSFIVRRSHAPKGINVHSLLLSTTYSLPARC